MYLHDTDGMAWPGVYSGNEGATKARRGRTGRGVLDGEQRQRPERDSGRGRGGERDEEREGESEERERRER